MRLDQYHPAHLTVDDIRWDVHVQLDDETWAFCEEQFKEKVTEQGSPSIVSHQMFNKEYLDMLKTEHDRGTISTEELEDEIGWMNFECEARAIFDIFGRWMRSIWRSFLTCMSP